MELVSLKLPYMNSSVTKIDVLNSSHVIVMLCGDGRIFLIDPDRNYSVIHEIKNIHNKVSFNLLKFSHLPGLLQFLDRQDARDYSVPLKRGKAPYLQYSSDAKP
jgi:hypothetical protein